LIDSVRYRGRDHIVAVTHPADKSAVCSFGDRFGFAEEKIPHTGEAHGGFDRPPYNRFDHRIVEEARRRRLILFDQAANCRADRCAARASIRHTPAPISQYQIANGDASATRLKTIRESTSAWTDRGKLQAESTTRYCKILFGDSGPQYDRDCRLRKPGTFPGDQLRCAAHHAIERVREACFEPAFSRRRDLT
jgi:hypothetical protein